jgi:hypothetical protein
MQPEVEPHADRADREGDPSDPSGRPAERYGPIAAAVISDRCSCKQRAAQPWNAERAPSDPPFARCARDRIRISEMAARWAGWARSQSSRGVAKRPNGSPDMGNSPHGWTYRRGDWPRGGVRPSHLEIAPAPAGSFLLNGIASYQTSQFCSLICLFSHPDPPFGFWVGPAEESRTPSGGGGVPPRIAARIEGPYSVQSSAALCRSLRGRMRNFLPFRDTSNLRVGGSRSGLRPRSACQRRWLADPSRRAITQLRVRGFDLRAKRVVESLPACH